MGLTIFRRGLGWVWAGFGWVWLEMRLSGFGLFLSGFDLFVEGDLGGFGVGLGLGWLGWV